MRKIFVILWIILLSITISGSGEENLNKKEAFLGIDCNMYNKEQAEVLKVWQDSPAEKAGLRKKDIILFMGDKKIGGPSEFFKKILTSSPNTETEIVIKRNNKEMIIKVMLGERPKNNRWSNVIFKDLINGSQVTLAIIVQQVDFFTPEYAFNNQVDTWKQNAKQALISEQTSIALNAFNAFENFKLIEGEKIEKVVDGLKVLQDKNLSQETRQKLISNIKATYVLKISISRTVQPPAFGSLGKCVDNVTLTLVSVKTGEIVQVNRGQRESNYSGNKIIKDWYEI